jgi:hypothetical protein
MPVEGRSPDLGQERKVARPRRLAQGLPTPRERVRKLQTSLQAKAKAEPAFRFYSLWDKICRPDVLTEAYRRCRHNAGAPGGQTFGAIEEHGVEEWLEELREELRNGRYRPKPLLRVWIPKSNGGQRPLGIPAISDRVAQMAALLVIGPIFETDLLANQYGFRPEMDAKMAIRRAFWHITDHGRTEVADVDLKDYFNTIPHGPLMRCVPYRRRHSAGGDQGLAHGSNHRARQARDAAEHGSQGQQPWDAAGRNYFAIIGEFVLPSLSAGVEQPRSSRSTRGTCRQLCR